MKEKIIQQSANASHAKKNSPWSTGCEWKSRFTALLFRVNREKSNFLHLFLRIYTVIKILAIFPSQAWRESLDSDIPAGDGKIANLFLQCIAEVYLVLYFVSVSDDVTMRPRMYPSRTFFGIIRPLNVASPYDPSLTWGGGGDISG
jgi:hypothetical protein